uniref:(California timema) hypothetical protein n=1 Tax=Timema californicum TaxID=61474 RepID=A0A7R9IVH8_TIMCA|nr:unnamed protein product [Timema californicum]
MARIIAAFDSIKNSHLQ